MSNGQGVRYQDHIGSLSRSEKTIQRVLSQSTRVHVLRDKLEPAQAQQWEAVAQQLGAQVTSRPEAANVVVTVLRAPKRVVKWFADGEVNVVPRKWGDEGEEEGQVDRRLGEGVGRDWRRFVVTPEWLEAVKREGTLVDPDLYAAVKVEMAVEAAAPAITEDGKRKRSPSDSPLVPTTHNPAPPPQLRRKVSPSSSSSTPSSYYDPLYPPATCPRWQNTRFACRRPSPLVSRNQPLIAELETIRNERRLTGDTYSEMAYMRAISALKAYPFPIPDPVLDPPHVFDAALLAVRLGEVEKLKGVGKKVFSLIRQFYSRCEAGAGGRIVEAKVIRRDRAVYVMNALTELYGIGPIGARQAYNAGARSFADVLHRGKSLATHLSAKESVRILGDLRKPIGRDECRTITEDIMTLVRSVLPHDAEVKYEICGGYRRGKAHTFDLDVIIGHGEAPSRALHMRLLDEMKRKGLITHIVNVGTPAPSDLDPDPTPNTAGAVHIDIANIVVLPTPSSAAKPVHRRVDLVFCPLRVYGATVLGWTGSLTFERDLRLWAKSKGFNFSFDGLTNLAEECLVETRDESDVFDALGLEWMPPEWRNCDA
ncbi:related to DNA polymerase mu [Sporisorium reilianum f. sp. reilianum]|uniref:DNA polymerase n=1 Tax=Sporisorium reilianum f. sp. reilianum TaxID=72559 RepID=A0A2N8U7F2_9BASI|nr:related to DNA polymerase mu [Sporisorium reilianum f. sp. reilianum]